MKTPSQWRRISTWFLLAPALSSRGRGSENWGLCAAAEQRAHSDFMILPIDVRLAVLHIVGSDGDSCLLDNAVKHDLKQLQGLIHNSLALQRTVTFKILVAKSPLPFCIACPEEQHVLVFGFVLAVPTCSRGTASGGCWPRRPFLGLVLCFADTSEICLLCKAIAVGVEYSKAQLSSHLDVTTFQVRNKGQELVEANDSIAIQVDCIKKGFPQSLVLSVAAEEGVELISIKRTGCQRGRVQAQEEVHLLQIVELLGAERTARTFALCRGL